MRIRRETTPRLDSVGNWLESILKPYFDAAGLAHAILPRQRRRDVGQLGATFCPIGQPVSRHFVSGFEAAPRRCASASRLKKRLWRLASNASPAARARSVAQMSTRHRSCIAYGASQSSVSVQSVYRTVAAPCEANSEGSRVAYTFAPKHAPKKSKIYKF